MKRCLKPARLVGCPELRPLQGRLRSTALITTTMKRSQAATWTACAPFPLLLLPRLLLPVEMLVASHFLMPRRGKLPTMLPLCLKLRCAIAQRPRFVSAACFA
jgi:hypothetical protein